MSFVQIVVLAGGTGGARFLRGVRAAAPGAEITAVVNTGDDVTMHGLRICPDLDTVMYTLGGGIDPERGWGRAGESWTVKEELAAYGAEPAWFGLGDRDLATHLVRTRMLDAGYPLSQVTAALADRWQPGVELLPMSDQRVETHVVVADPATGRQQALHFQAWWVRHRAEPEPRAFVQGGGDAGKPAPGAAAGVSAAPRRARAPRLRAGGGGRGEAGAGRGRGVRRRRRRAAGALEPGGVDRHRPGRPGTAAGAAGHARPGRRGLADRRGQRRARDGRPLPAGPRRGGQRGGGGAALRRPVRRRAARRLAGAHRRPRRPPRCRRPRRPAAHVLPRGDRGDGAGRAGRRRCLRSRPRGSPSSRCGDCRSSPPATTSPRRWRVQHPGWPTATSSS